MSSVDYNDLDELDEHVDWNKVESPAAHKGPPERYRMYIIPKRHAPPPLTARVSLMLRTQLDNVLDYVMSFFAPLDPATARRRILHSRDD